MNRSRALQIIDDAIVVAIETASDADRKEIEKAREVLHEAWDLIITQP